MKKQTLVLLALITFLIMPGESQAPATVEATAWQSETLISEARPYNRRRIQRKNTPDKTNARNKRALRKLGLAQVETVVVWKGGVQS